MPDTHTTIDTRPEHGAGWLRRTDSLQSVSPERADTAGNGGSEWQWIQPARPTPPEPTTTSRWARMPRRVSIGLAAALSVSGVLVGTGIVSSLDHEYTPALIPTITVGPPPSTSAAAETEACAGLSGRTVTAAAGDRRSLPGVIAAFEHAYYVQRDAEAALRLVAPEAGLALEALAAGIASIPPGTTHCVAITPIDDRAAEVHLVELHPGGERIDYLQLINVHHTPGNGVVITNIQKRG